MKKILFALVALLGIVACEEQLPKDPAQTLTITADKLSIEANGEDMATFTVTDKEGNVVDADIRFYETNETLEGNTFKTKYAGEYSFIAYSTNYLNDRLVNLDKKVTIRYKGKKIARIKPRRTIANLHSSLNQRGDRSYAFPCIVDVEIK